MSITEAMIEAASREIAMGMDDQPENWIEYSSIARAALEAAQSAAPAVDEGMALHWIDRYAAGIDEWPQMNRIKAALGVQAK